MSTPDCVIFENKKIRLEIKDGEPLINGKPAADCWKKHDLRPETGIYLHVSRGTRCGCLVGIVSVEVVGVEGTKAVIENDLIVATAVARETHVPLVIMRGIESGFEDYPGPHREGDDEETWRLARRFGALVRKQVGFGECRF